MKTGESAWKDIVGDSRGFERATENETVDEKQKTNSMINNWLVDNSGLADKEAHDKKNETEKTEQRQNNVSILRQDYS